MNTTMDNIADKNLHARPEELSRPHTRGCLPSLRAVRLYLKADLYRYQGDGRLKFWRHFLFTPGYKYTVWMRLTGWAMRRKSTRYTIGLPLKGILLHCRHKYGIAIPEYTDIGPGLFINRFGGIYVNGDAIVGSNVNISQMCLVGQTNRGARAGSPIIMNRVAISFGACVLGRVRIGAGAIVGANAVVTRDVKDKAVVGGIPAKVLSMDGSKDYVNRTVPEDLLAACYEANQRQPSPTHRPRFEESRQRAGHPPAGREQWTKREKNTTA
jgi:serine O-acetyltransferase